MNFLSIIQILISISGFFIKIFRGKEESLKWMNKTAASLHTKGWADKSFITKLEADREAYLIDLIKKKKIVLTDIEKEENETK